MTRKEYKKLENTSVLTRNGNLGGISETAVGFFTMATDNGKVGHIN